MPLVFLTKVDSYDPDVIGQDLTKTFHSARLLSLMEVSYSWLDALEVQEAASCWQCHQTALHKTLTHLSRLLD